MMRRGISLVEISYRHRFMMVAAMVPLWGLMGSSHRQVTLSGLTTKYGQVSLLQKCWNR